MVETIPADLMMMFIVGLLFSWQTSRQIQKEGSLFLNKYFGTLLLFQTLIVMPQAILYYRLHPDWCWMYWLDSKKVSSALVVITYFAYYPAMILGYLLGYYLEKKKIHSSFWAIKLSLLFFCLFGLFTAKRLFYVGTAEEFQLGLLTPLFFMPSLSLMVFGGMGVSLAVLFLILRRFGRELDFHYGDESLTSFRQENPVIAVQKIDGDVRDAIRASLQVWHGLEYLQNLLPQQGGRAIIKANFAGGGKDKKGTQTSPEVLEATIDLLREIQSDVEILVVESGSIFWWELEPLMKNSVYEKLFSEKNVQFVNLSKTDRRQYDFGGRIGEDEIAGILLEPHLLIDAPVAKTHAYFRMSGAVKNLFGLLPEGYKLFRYHAGKGLDDGGRIFLDIYRNFPPHLIVMDGIVSCEGHGPLGIAKETGFVITSNDAVAADVALSQIMGYEVKQVPYLRILWEEGFPLDFHSVGDALESVKPESWRKTSKLWGLTVNSYRIAGEHFRAKSSES